MLRRGFLTLFALFTVLLLTACGAAAPSTPPAAEATAAPDAPVAEATAAPDAPADPFKVAIVMPSTVSDLAWSQAMIDGLKIVQTEMGGEAAMEIVVSENMFNVTDAAAALRDYASSGNDLVIAHGTQYGTSMFEIAKDFPEVSFAWGTAIDIGADQGLSNVFAYNASAQEGGYINGVIAGLLSKSDIVGVVGPVEAGDAKAYIDGFEQGVLSVKPAAKVNKIYTGSFGDTAQAAEAVTTHITAGADVLTGSAQQVVGAVGVAKEKGVLWFGTQSDQSSLAPELVVATQVYDWTGVLKDMIAQIQAGTLGGTAYDLTLENGGLKIVFNEGFTGVPPEVTAAVEEAIAAISSGAVNPLP